MRESIMTTISRRRLVAGVAAMSACMSTAGRSSLAAEPGEQWFDFTGPLRGWESVSGGWSIEEVPGARTGRALVQRAIENEFNVIVAPGGPYDDVLVSVRFQPIAGREDASGGIVFRFSDGRYYLARANALEDNFRLYYYDQKRYQLASANVKPPLIGKWHSLRVIAVASLIQAYFDGKLLLDRRDSRFRSGRVGLWTKTDSVTAFDDLEIKGYKSK